MDNENKTSTVTENAQGCAPLTKSEELTLAMSMGELELTQVLERLGISEEGYLEMLRSGEFRHEVIPLSRLISESEAPMIFKALTETAKRGNTTAIRLYFDIFGKDIGIGGGGAVEYDSDLEEIAELRRSIFSED